MVHSNSEGVPAPAGPAGENLAMFSNKQGAEAVVDAWYEEVNNIISYDP